MEQTPWEALKSFLREYDHKDGNYTEVTFNYEGPNNSVTLRNVFGNIVILTGNFNVDFPILRGLVLGNARLLESFKRNGKSIHFMSSKDILPETNKYAKKSFLDLELKYWKNKFRISCVISCGITMIEYEKVTSIEYNREVHDVIPEDLQGGDIYPEGRDDPDCDPNPSSDLRRVVVQEGCGSRMN